MALAREEAASPERTASNKITILGLGGTAVLYFLAAAYLVSLSLNVMTADAVSYLRIAEYYAQGRFDLAVNSCWGPLLSWLLVPSALLKTDLPLAVRVVQVLSGFGFALGVALLTRRFTGGRGTVLGFAAGALLALPMIPYSITPDMTMACFITLYLACIAPLLSGGSLRWAVAAGLIGGMAFLTKHYALPFVVGHMGLTLAARWFLARKGLLQEPVARPILLAAGSFLVIALPWIAAMSIHDGSFTVSSAGRYAKASTYARLHHTKYPDHRLQMPREGRIVVSENRLEGKHGLPDFPSITSVAGVRDRLAHLKYYGSYAVEVTKSADLFGLLLCAGLIVLLRVAWVGGALSDRSGIHGIWACCSAGLYAAGYVLTNVEERLLWPMWGILAALAVTVFVFPWTAVPTLSGRRWMTGAVMCAWGALLVGSVGHSAVDSLLNCGERVAWYTDCRKAAETMPFQGRFAVSGTGKELNVAYAMAYWSDTPLLGTLDGTSPEAIAGELKEFGEAQVLIIYNAGLVERLRRHGQFEFLQEVKERSGGRSYSLFAFHPAPAGTGAGS